MIKKKKKKILVIKLLTTINVLNVFTFGFSDKNNNIFQRGSDWSIIEATGRTCIT